MPGRNMSSGYEGFIFQTKALHFTGSAGALARI